MKTTYLPRPEISLRVYSKVNHGLIHSLRCALNLVRGKYVVFIAGDDAYVPTDLADALTFVSRSDPPIDALIGQAVSITAPETLIYGAGMSLFFGMSPFERLDVLWREPPKPMLLQSAIFRTEFLRRLNPWVDGLELDDWPLFIRVFVAEAHFGSVIRYKPELKFCRYRIHPDGVHMNLDRQLRITEQVADVFVPTRYRSTCLANARIDNGLIRLYQGEWRDGVKILVRGLMTSPSFPVVKRLGIRALRFVHKRIAMRLSKSM